jgi:hypothetical protein
LATKKSAVQAEANEDLDLVYGAIRKLFVHHADIVARNEKPERLLKMIQSCPELKPVKRANKELWQLLKKVRRDVMGNGKSGGKRSAGSAKTRATR